MSLAIGTPASLKLLHKISLGQAKNVIFTARQKHSATDTLCKCLFKGFLKIYRKPFVMTRFLVKCQAKAVTNFRQILDFFNYYLP